MPLLSTLLYNLSAVLTWSVLAQQSELPLVDEAIASRKMTRGFQSARTPYVGLNLFESIGPVEFEMYAEVLKLHDAQRKAISSFYSKYVSSVNSVFDERLPQLLERSAILAATGSGMQNTRSARDLADLLSDVAEVNQQIVRLDHGFFSEIEAVVAESQLAPLESVRNHRARTRCSVTPCEYPGARYDLAFAIYTLNNKKVLPGVELSSFQELLAQYELQRTHLIARFHHVKEKIVVDSAMIFATLNEFRAANPEPKALSALEESTLTEYTRCVRPGNILSKRLHDLNKLYLDLFEVILPDESIRRIRAEFRTNAYPPVFPNPFECDEVLLEAANFKDLNEEQREVVAAATFNYEIEVEDASDRMVHEYLQHMERFQKYRTFDQAEMAEHKQRMTALQERRKKIANKSIGILRESLSPGQLDSLNPVIQDFEERSQSHRSSERGLHFVP